MTNRSALLILLFAIATVTIIWVLAGSRHKGAVQSHVKQQVQDKREMGQGQDDGISSPSQNAQANALPSVGGLSLTKSGQDNLAKIMTAFSAPISFYGKVIDQYGEPVPDAKIHYSAADQYFGNSSKYEGTSTADGSFSIKGIKGAGVYVSVYKEGYDGTPQSGGGFGYGVPTGNRPPTEGNPAVFVLRKKGSAEPLVVVSSRQYEVSKIGEPVGLSLTNARKVDPAQADVEVQSWVDDQSKDQQGHFDWRCKVSAPRGGLIQRQDDFAFEAPELGYQAADEIVMARSNDKWNRDVERDYFVKLQNNTYAHVKIEMMAGGNYNFFVLESYLNPHPGDRNLEFDQAKRINPH